MTIHDVPVIERYGIPCFDFALSADELVDRTLSLSKRQIMVAQLTLSDGLDRCVNAEYPEIIDGIHHFYLYTVGNLKKYGIK